MPRLYRLLIPTLLAALAAVSAAAAASGSLAAPRGRAASGGLTAAGGGYSVSGSLGGAEAGQLSGGGYRVSGGALWPLPEPAPAPAAPRTIYLPLVLRDPCQSATREREPNNNFAQANGPLCPRAEVDGTHDGQAGTGDLFKVRLEAGQTLSAALSTDDPAGVQLVLYNSSAEMRAQAAAPPFAFSYPASAAGWYYLYVFSDPAKNNTAGYILRAQVTGP